jgi:hypothetical protein
MQKKPSKRAIDEEQWMRTRAGRLIVVERRMKRVIRDCERYLRVLDEGRRLLRDGYLSEGKFREIHGDVDLKKAAVKELIAEYRRFLARHEGN